jgi:hypothetical protein
MLGLRLVDEFYEYGIRKLSQRGLYQCANMDKVLVSANHRFYHWEGTYWLSDGIHLVWLISVAIEIKYGS